MVDRTVPDRGRFYLFVHLHYVCLLFVNENIAAGALRDFFHWTNENFMTIHLDWWLQEVMATAEHRTNQLARWELIRKLFFILFNSRSHRIDNSRSF